MSDTIVQVYHYTNATDIASSILSNSHFALYKAEKAIWWREAYYVSEELWGRPITHQTIHEVYGNLGKSTHVWLMRDGADSWSLSLKCGKTIKYLNIDGDNEVPIEKIMCIVHSSLDAKVARVPDDEVQSLCNTIIKDRNLTKIRLPKTYNISIFHDIVEKVQL